MRFIPVSCQQREAMLRAVGVSGIGELFASIPPDVRLDRPIELPDGLTEMEVVARLRMLADANTPAGGLVSFAGAGCYDHYVPSIVDHVLRKPEFFTAYTPYQPEVSQGTLQNIYEFQSMICELTGMDVANASMYDGATAFAEGALMAARVTKRDRVVVSGAVHPEWRAVLETYAEAGVLEVVTLPETGGRSDPSAAAVVLDDTVAALLVTSPTFLGTLEDLVALGEAAHAVGALFVVGTNPILLGVLEPPSSAGADIVVGEGQVLGGAMSFGGPGLGLFAARQAHLRQMPGRIVGRTLDADGAMAFVLTMQTREQHIRREKATSNICSNHALNERTGGRGPSVRGQGPLPARAAVGHGTVLVRVGCAVRA
jgi:glycine dehydrogenase subunit 1